MEPSQARSKNKETVKPVMGLLIPASGNGNNSCPCLMYSEQVISTSTLSSGEGNVATLDKRPPLRKLGERGFCQRSIENVRQESPQSTRVVVAMVTE